MNKDLFEKVEYLRVNTNIGYEKAAVLLERHGEDLTQAMIELERSNKMSQKGNPWDNVLTRGKEHVRNFQGSDNWFKKLLRAKVQVTRDGKKVADVPVLVPIIAAICMHHVVIAVVFIGGLTGFRVRNPRSTLQSEGSAV